MLSFGRCCSRCFTKPVQDAVRSVVTRTADSSEVVDQAPKGISAKSEKSKVQWRRSEGDRGCCRDAKGKPGDTSKRAFLLRRQRQRWKCELGVAQEGRRDARIRPRAFHTGASLPLTPVVKYRVNCRGFVSIDMSTRCYQATRAMRQLCVCFWQRSFDVEVIWRGVSDVSEW